MLISGSLFKDGDSLRVSTTMSDLATNALQLILQIGVTRLLMSRYGVVAALIADGAVKGVALLATILSSGEKSV